MLVIPEKLPSKHVCGACDLGVTVSAKLTPPDGGGSGGGGGTPLIAEQKDKIYPVLQTRLQNRTISYRLEKSLLLWKLKRSKQLWVFFFFHPLGPC